MRTLLSFLVLAATIPGSAAAQTLLWQNAGQPALGGSALDVDVQGDVVAACGGTYDQEYNAAWYVRGIDRDTGSTLWEDAFPFVWFDQANACRVSGGRVYAVGWTFDPFFTGFRFVVRAYDMRDGTLDWEQSISRMGWDVGKSVVIEDGRVHVAGHIRTETSSDFAVLTFDEATGALLWESIVNPSGQAQNDYAWTIAAGDGRVYVGGEIENQSAFLVRTLDAASGALVWQQRIEGMRTWASERTLAVSEGVAVVIGEIGFESAVYAYDAATGELRWSEILPDGAAQPSMVAASGDRAIVAGLTGCDPVTWVDCELAVRAFDLFSGQPQWEDIVVAPGGDWWPFVHVAFTGGRVYVAGESLDPAFDAVAVLRAYSARNGALVWQESFDGGPGWDGIGSMAVSGGRLYVAGGMGRPDFENDFFVRAYSLR